jgi:hypothetical protein
MLIYDERHLRSDLGQYAGRPHLLAPMRLRAVASIHSLGLSAIEIRLGSMAISSAPDTLECSHHSSQGPDL